MIPSLQLCSKVAGFGVISILGSRFCANRRWRVGGSGFLNDVTHHVAFLGVVYDDGLAGVAGKVVGFVDEEPEGDC